MKLSGITEHGLNLIKEKNLKEGVFHKGQKKLFCKKIHKKNPKLFESFLLTNNLQNKIPKFLKKKNFKKYLQKKNQEFQNLF